MRCECGCGQKTSIIQKTVPSKGLVAGEHRRFICGHHTRHNKPYYIVNDKGCWIWARALNEFGYGIWNLPEEVFGKEKPPATLAHRVMFWLEWGWLPDSDLDHTCQVKQCVNPDHLEPCERRLNQVYMQVYNILLTRGVEPNPLLIRKRVKRMIEKLAA